LPAQGKIVKIVFADCFRRLFSQIVFAI
jgi:hypothetical protein